MHDWTLLSLSVDWDQGRVSLDFRSPLGLKTIRASDFRKLSVPRACPWGSSVSVNVVDGPTTQDDGLSRLAIEMQSGDRIEIVAREFEMPDNTKNAA